MTINEHFNFLNFIVRKNRGGYISPDEFNLLAQRSNYELFFTIDGNPQEYKQNTPLPKQTKGVSAQVDEALKAFLDKPKVIQLDDDGETTYPDNYYRATSIRSLQYFTDENGEKVSSERDIEFVNDGQLGSRLDSSLYGIKPSKDYPICHFYSDTIKVWPKKINTVYLTYLRYPKNPEWGFNMTAKGPVYDATQSTDFEWGEQWHNQLVVMMAGYVGISIRENQMIQYSELMKEKGI